MALFEKKYLPELILFLFSILLYSNTLNHGFVFDDQMVLTKNEIVKQGFAGLPSIFGKDSFAGYERLVGFNNTLSGGRYRPLSLAFFAILYSIFGENNFIFHAFNVMLYAASVILVFKLFQRLLQTFPDAKMMAWLIAILFASHPLHTEVVANIKGCDEILGLIFGMGSWICLLNAFDTQRKWPAWVAGALLFLACLSKENAIMLGILVPISLWLFIKTSLPSVLRKSVPFIIAIAGYLLVRSIATADNPAGANLTADPLNNVFLVWNGQTWVNCTFAQRLATIVVNIGHQLSLLIYPHPLTHDYYHLKLSGFNEVQTWISLICIFVLTVYGLLGLINRYKNENNAANWNAYSQFGILFLLATLSLTSNIFFSVGAFMAERFLFLPSIGFCLAIVFWGFKLKNWIPQQLLLGLFGLIILVFSMLTILRNPAWKSDETLLVSALPYSSESPKLNKDYGTVLLEKALKETDENIRKKMLETAYIHLEKALENHPTYYDAFLAKGACAYYLGRYNEAVTSYESAYRQFPNDPKSKTGLQYALQAKAADLGNKKQYPEAIKTMKAAWDLQPDTLSAMHLARFYGSENDQIKKLEWLRNALKLMPDDAKIKEELNKEIQ